jgi:predicted TIM-barrel enzyme
VPVAQAAGWAAHLGANGLVLTGSTFAESIEYLQAVRGAGIRVPRLLGGSATAENVGEVLANAEGVIVSTALFRDGAPNHQLVQWDYDKTARFMERARQGLV